MLPQVCTSTTCTTSSSSVAGEVTLKKKEKTNTMKIFTELSGSESGPQVKKELEMESRLLWL